MLEPEPEGLEYDDRTCEECPAPAERVPTEELRCVVLLVLTLRVT
jgi:hypothetical protein